MRAVVPEALGRQLLVHLAVYTTLLGLLAVSSWLGDGWGYLALYGLILAIFSLVVGGGWLVLRSIGQRADSFVRRSLRSFARAQGTLAVALVGAGIVARLTPGPLGPFAGGAFEGKPSLDPLPDDLIVDGREIQLQISSETPYTINVHGFLIRGCLYVGADFVFPFKKWVHAVEADDRVLLRVGSRLFESRVVRIRDADESRALLEEVSRRRGVDPDDWLTDVWFFRLGCVE